MNLRVFDNKVEMGSAAASQAATAIRQATRRQGQARIIVATGASQFEFLEALTAMPEIDWPKVEMFHLDEYIGLPVTHPASFRKYLLERLISKGFKVEETLLAFWIPFIAADLGNFFGGGVSSWLIRRGWPVGRARKAVVIFGGLGMTLLIPTIFTSSLFAIAGLFAISTFAYAAFSTMAIVLPSDVYRHDVVATVSGMSGTGAGIGTILSTYLIGYVADHYSFGPVLMAASLIPLLGAVLVLLLVHNTQASEMGLLRRI